MRTVEGDEDRRGSLWSRLRSDAALLVRIQRMLVHYFATGARIRRTYRAKEAAGETFWVDE